jgi:thiol:disulfide interchange protein DsbD
MALYFIRPLLPDAIAAKILWLDAIGSGIFLILFSRAGESARPFVLIKNLLAIIAIIIGAWFLKPEKAGQAEMQWQSFSTQAYESALQAHKPIILDFFADWCIPCRELDEYTFSDPEVIRLSKDFVLLKIDLTGSVTSEVRALQERYEVKGVPTIIFIAGNGRELIEQRLLGFEKAESVVRRIQKVLEQP